MYGNFKTLSVEQIKKFEEKFKLKKVDENTYSCQSSDGKTYLRQMNEKYQFRCYDSVDNPIIQFASIWVTPTALKLYFGKYSEVNKILDYYNDRVSVFQIQNTINSLKIKNIYPTEEAIEEELFKDRSSWIQQTKEV